MSSSRIISAWEGHTGARTNSSHHSYLINQIPGEKLRYDVEGLALRLWTLP